MSVELESWQIHEDTIYNNLVAASQSSPGVFLPPGTPPSSAVPLAGIQYVGRSIPPELNIFPYVAVQFDEYKEGWEASHRDEVMETFSLLIAVEAIFDPATPDTVQAGRAQLRQYVNDGNGNGLSPLLRANTTVSGTAIFARITNMKIIPWKGMGESAAGTVVWALYTYEILSRVSF